MSSDFRQLAVRSDKGRHDGLLKAAVSAFCSLTRPSRRESAQLEDLALPLLDGVSVETLRYVAAALSESPTVPSTLVRRLADMSVDIAAPLLIRSSALSDVDLIALIGRHGLPHARAIARREGLHQTISDLVRALDRPAAAPAVPPAPAPIAEKPPVEVDFAAQRSVESSVPRATPRADVVRRRLRDMMRPAEQHEAERADVNRQPAVFRKLRDGALTGDPLLFAGTLAELLRIDPLRARAIVESDSYADLTVAMRALGLTEEEAYLVASAVFGPHFGHAETVRLFVERYRLIDRDQANEKVRAWRAAGLSFLLRPARPRADNDGSLAGHDLAQRSPAFAGTSMAS